MFEIELSAENLTAIDGTSDGTQNKYFKDGYWYKQDEYGGEGNAEALVSILLRASTLKPEEFVAYEHGIINGRKGCRSKDFTRFGEEFITLYRFYQFMTGRKLNVDVNHLNTPGERADYVLNFFSRHCSLDLSEYFSKIFTLDALILNEDRHFNNLGIIRRNNGSYRTAPIFDHGKSLLVGNMSIRPDMEICECVRRTSAQPFSGSFEKNKALFGTGFSIDLKRCLQLLSKEPDSFEKKVLLYQLQAGGYHGI